MDPGLREIAAHTKTPEHVAKKMMMYARAKAEDRTIDGDLELESPVMIATYPPNPAVLIEESDYAYPGPPGCRHWSTSDLTGLTLRRFVPCPRVLISQMPSLLWMSVPPRWWNRGCDSKAPLLPNPRQGSLFATTGVAAPCRGCFREITRA